MCVTRNCSAETWICDGDYDCFDSSDELNCSQNQVENIYCSINEFYCKDKITCIHPSWICDGEDDCLNGEDESLDKCQHYDCKKNEFECQNKTCIPAPKEKIQWSQIRGFGWPLNGPSPTNPTIIKYFIEVLPDYPIENTHMGTHVGCCVGAHMSIHMAFHMNSHMGDRVVN
uniref:Vitellogenin receptor n=1 Tax=Trichogramma kaykai TaxID=54128 RepID=A0ABD2WAT5_9HYME